MKVLQALINSLKLDFKGSVGMDPSTLKGKVCHNRALTRLEELITEYKNGEIAEEYLQAIIKKV